VSGRPTLKRRQLSATAGTANEVRANEQVAQKEICISDKSEANAANHKQPLSGPIAEIRFEGNRIFSSSELAGKLQECRTKYEDSDTGYSPERFDYCLHRLAVFLRSRGYLEAKVGEPKNELNTQGLVLILPIEEGVLYRLGKIEIGGVNVFSPKEIRATLSLREEDVADGEAIGKWLFEDLKSRYAERGYLQFTAEVEPEFKVAAHNESEGVVNLRVTVEEGQQFKVGSITFQGSNLPQKELRDMLLVREGDVFNQLFEDSVKRINETGWFEVIDKDKDTDFTTNDEESQVSIVIKISERRAAARGSEP
jgi:outer membrane protein insertion porin family